MRLSIKTAPVLPLLFLLVLQASLVGCENSRPIHQGWPPDGGAPLLFSQSHQTEVDLLFVIDNSSSMEGVQAVLRSNPFFMAALKSAVGGIPDLHLGVISTDVGTGSPSGTGCEEAGDAGFLLTGTCTNPVGAPYIVDVAATGCDILRADNGNTCLDHNCDQTHCAHEPSTTFSVDSTTGCPRCRNYTGESLGDVFGCISSLGTVGCDFEQPLESMRLALTPDNAHNEGFLRESSVLAIVLITDEDDCSAKDDLIFDPEDAAPDGPLGPFTSFRCFEQGVTCDVNDRFATGPRHHCVAREDSASLLHPLSRYVDFLDSIKDRELVSVTVLGGPVIPSADGDGFDAEVELDLDQNPLLQWSCSLPGGGGVPGIRLHAFAAAFHEPAALDTWAYTSICSGDLAPSLAGIGYTFALLQYQCLPAPLRGCADPGVEYGTPRAPQTCEVNARCLPQCVVEDIFDHDLPSEQYTPVPPCLEVATDGTLLPGNTDHALAYANGMPNQRDAALPVSACWFIDYQELCTSSNYAEILIARPADPPARTFATVQCGFNPPDEQTCDDGVDNDEDCLVDQDDPCCQNSANCTDGAN